MLSAKYFAQSTVPFEEVALKFVERDERDALRSYLLTKVDKLKKVVRFNVSDQLLAIAITVILELTLSPCIWIL
jgi:hypothetical protein